MRTTVSTAAVEMLSSEAKGNWVPPHTKTSRLLLNCEVAVSFLLQCDVLHREKCGPAGPAGPTGGSGPGAGEEPLPLQRPPEVLQRKTPTPTITRQRTQRAPNEAALFKGQLVRWFAPRHSLSEVT